MEPRIQYAHTSDGVSLAFWTLGEGPPLLITPPLSISHTELEWRSPEIARWYLKMAERRRIVRYDPRGCALSQREVADLSLDAYVADMEAVADHLQLECFALMAIRAGGPSAIAYSARHPERVTHLVLWSCMARYADAFAYQHHEMLQPMNAKDWEAYTETHAHIQLGWDNPRAHELAQFIRASIEPDVWEAMLGALNDVDVSPLLGKIACPTLVLAGRDYPVPRATTEIAAAIPNATLVPLKEGAHPAAGNTDTIDAVIDEFLGGSPETGTKVELPSGTAVILFADIADSTGRTEHLGDAAFREKARALDTALRGIVRDNGGTPVDGKLLGDGVLAVFTSARQAIEAALACGRAGDEGGLPLHLGLHAGDVIREDNNVYGGAVNIAARISALSAPGELLVSDTLRGLARTSAAVTFDDRGERELKGVGEPVRVWAVRAQEGA